MSTAINSPGHDSLWQWFGLSRAAWLTMPRVLMHGMPDDWQQRMAQLLMEWDAAWGPIPKVDKLTFTVAAKNGNGFARMPEWLLNYRHPDSAFIASLRTAVDVSTATPSPAVSEEMRDTIRKAIEFVEECHGGEPHPFKDIEAMAGRLRAALGEG